MSACRGRRLLQRHARMDMGNRGEGVDHHGTARRPLDDDGKSVPQAWLPQQFDLGPQMGDEHTSNPQEVRLVSDGFGLKARTPPLSSEHMFATQRPLVPTRASEGRRKMRSAVLCCALRGRLPRCGRLHQEVDGMPTFDTVPIGEARANTVTGQRAALLQEYVGFIQGRAPWTCGEAGARRGRDDPGGPAEA